MSKKVSSSLPELEEDCWPVQSVRVRAGKLAKGMLSRVEGIVFL
jgi:hypothetical protein